MEEILLINNNLRVSEKEKTLEWYANLKEDDKTNVSEIVNCLRGKGVEIYAVGSSLKKDSNYHNIGLGIIDPKAINKIQIYDEFSKYINSTFGKGFKNINFVEEISNCTEYEKAKVIITPEKGSKIDLMFPAASASCGCSVPLLVYLNCKSFEIIGDVNKKLEKNELVIVYRSN